MMFSNIVQNERNIFLIFYFTVAFLIADTMINYVSDLIVPFLISTGSLIFFIVIVVVYIFGLFFITEFVKRQSREIRAKDRYVRLINSIVMAAMYVLVAIIILVVSEILITSQYHTLMLIATTAIIELVTIGVLGFFAERFFSWFKVNRNSMVVLLYGLSFAVSALSLAIISIQDLYLLPLKDPMVNAQSEVIFPYDYIEPGSFFDSLFSAYRYVDLVSFVLLICATGFLLRHYFKKLGKLKFWIVISLPLLYYLSTFIETFGLYTPSTDLEWLYWWLYISLNSTAGGILFGIAFLTVAETIRHNSPVRQYLRITAFGFILMFISNQVTLIGASYPPFGITTMSFLLLASYMIFLGLYSTAISISQDNQLRKSIKKFATHDTNLLSSIGTAQMDQEIQRTVNSMKQVVQKQEKELEEQTGIEANMAEDEMKNYLQEVMQEIGKANNKPSP